MSTNTFFYQDAETLSRKRLLVESYLELKRFTSDQITWFLRAYDYFCDKEGYDGSTWTQDLYCIPGLELWSMLHDYFYIALNVWASRRYQRKADKILRLTMHKGDDAGFEMNWRTFRLFFLRGLYPWYNRNFKGRRMTKHNKIQMEAAYAAFAK